MTLDEAIEYHKKQVVHYRDLSDLYESYNDKEDAKMNMDKATEHWHIMEWLKELKEWQRLDYVCSRDGIFVFKYKEGE